MIRTPLAAVAAVLCLSGAAQAQAFTGTWTTTTPNGNTVTVQLAQDARGQVTGNLSASNGTTFAIEGRALRGQLSGFATGTGTRVSVRGAQSGPTLSLTLADVGQDGQPVPNGQAQTLSLSRSAPQGQAVGVAPGKAPGGQAAGSSGGIAGGGRGDPYVGTFSGNGVTITLRRNGAGYSGSATSSNGQYVLQAQMADGVLNGMYNDNGTQRTFQAVVQGDVMQMADGGNQVMLQRQAGGAASTGIARGQESQEMPGTVPPRGGQAGGVAGTGPQDRQIAQLFVSSRWCYMSYSQTSGTTRTERVQYFPNGTVVQTTGGETYNSGPNGSVAGQSSGGQRGMWRIQNGILMLTADGAQWTPVPIQITRNSNGYPIVTAGGKEYSQCN